VANYLAALGFLLLDRRRARTFTRWIVGFAVHRGVVDGMALWRMFNRALHTQTLPPSPTRREFRIVLRLNTVERGYQAKVYNFNNRKDDVFFSKGN
jgi:hypothetical protein